MANFIDFLQKAQEDNALIQDFLKQNTAKELKEFFDKKKYKEITLEDCRKLEKMKKDLPPLPPGSYPPAY